MSKQTASQDNFFLQSLPDIIIIVGHYGTGKTNLATNLAVDFRKQGEEVLLIDLDTVNPYFRSADFMELAEAKGFEILAPPFANTNLDMPALSGRIDAVLAMEPITKKRIILDVGGDSAGAVALGRYAALLIERGYSMLYVVNSFRLQTQPPENAVEYLRQIEQSSRLKADYVVNNSNLSYETTENHVERSLAYGDSVAAQAGIPLLFHSIPNKLYSEELSQKAPFYPVSIYVKPPWSSAE